MTNQEWDKLREQVKDYYQHYLGSNETDSPIKKAVLTLIDAVKQLEEDSALDMLSRGVWK